MLHTDLDIGDANEWGECTLVKREKKRMNNTERNLLRRLLNEWQRDILSLWAT